MQLRPAAADDAAKELSQTLNCCNAGSQPECNPRQTPLCCRGCHLERKRLSHATIQDRYKGRRGSREAHSYPKLPFGSIQSSLRRVSGRGEPVASRFQVFSTPWNRTFGRLENSDLPKLEIKLFLPTVKGTLAKW